MNDRRVLLDAGPLVALASPRDARHQECTTLLTEIDAPLLTCWPVITEAAWLVRREQGSIGRIFEAIQDGLFEILDLDAGAIEWLPTFLHRYESIRAQLADAALVYLAEREDIGTVFTLDLGDFSVYRVGRNRALRLIPGSP